MGANISAFCPGCKQHWEDCLCSELIETLEGVTRIVEAFSYTNRLGDTQSKRLKRAKDLLFKIKEQTNHVI